MKPHANHTKLVETMNSLGYTKDEVDQCIKVLNNRTTSLLEEKKAIVENAKTLVSKPNNSSMEELKLPVEACNLVVKKALERAAQLDRKIQESIYSETQLRIIREIQKLTEEVNKEPVPASPGANPNLVLVMKEVNTYVFLVFLLLFFWMLVAYKK